MKVQSRLLLLALIASAVAECTWKDVSQACLGGTVLPPESRTDWHPITLTRADGVVVPCGAFVSPNAMVDPPLIKVGGARKPGSRIALVMVDPDAPSAAAPQMAEWLHWLTLDEGNDEGVVSYTGPTPPVGLHRYVVVALEYSGERSLVPPPPRMKFSLARFVRQQGMRVIGATYFVSSKSADDALSTPWSARCGK